MYDKSRNASVTFSHVASTDFNHPLSFLACLGILPGTYSIAFRGMSSLYHTYRQHGQLMEVGMDDVRILTPDSTEMAIGTRGLNGCTCVVIIGPRAILLAHISPLPGPSAADWLLVPYEARRAACHDHHRSFLQMIEGLVQRNDQHFPFPNTAWGVFAVDLDEGPLQCVADQIHTDLSTLDFRVQEAVYKEIDPMRARPPKGELVGVRFPEGPRLYLESQQLWPKQPDVIPSVSAEHDPSSALPQSQGSIDLNPQTPSSYWTWSSSQQAVDFHISRRESTTIGQGANTPRKGTSFLH